MPCTDGRDDDARETLARLDEVTRLLCETCRAGKPTKAAMRWFEKHKRLDEQREREAVESKKREIADLRRRQRAIERDLNGGRRR